MTANDDLTEIKSCEVCGGVTLLPVVNLGHHPMCDDLVQVGDDRVLEKYPIEILFCEACCTAHQKFQIKKKVLFPKTYHYRSRHTADVLNGMKALVSSCEATFGSLDGKKVLDIGCNDGSLLDFFAEKGAKTFGIEPTEAALDALEKNHHVIYEYFSESVAEAFVGKYGQPDIITFTNVFAHIEDLKAVLRGLRIASHKDTRIVIENHYLGAILEKKQFDTFYHEHPRTYSLTSFVHIAKSLGMHIVLAEFPKRYGGNIRVFLSADSSGFVPKDVITKELDRERCFGIELNNLEKYITIWRRNKSEEISGLVKQHGPLLGKAFPGRAAIPIEILGLSTDQFAATYEKPLSAKIDHYIPGTHIPIKSDDLFANDSAKATVLLNLAWHISDEIRKYLIGRGFSGTIIDIISPSDFSERR